MPSTTLNIAAIPQADIKHDKETVKNWWGHDLDSQHQIEAFFIVWSPKLGVHSTQFPNIEKANAVAARLATANVGQQFFVMQAQGVHEAVVDTLYSKAV